MMLRPLPLCTKLARSALHRRGNHAAAISHRLVSQHLSIDNRIALNRKCALQTRTLATTNTNPPTTAAASISSDKKSVDKSQEAIEKAEQLHKELNEMIKAQKDRQHEEAQRPIGSGLVQFFKASKPEMFNIFFAFVCVLLAYQIHKMRAGIKKLLADQEEKKAEIDRLRGLLAILSKEETTSDNVSYNNFTMTLAEKCTDVVRTMFEESEKKAGYGWILGRRLASRDSMETETLVEEMEVVVANEIQSIIGEAAYTEEELKERRVAALKQEDTGKKSVGREAQLGGLMDILEEVHKADLPDGEKTGETADSTSGKVRRTRYAI